MKEKDKLKRDNRVLEIIVETYIDKAEPIGSSLVSRKLGFSSATVRNIMAELEDEGYIYQPYTSAGRIPTDKGYRYYVDRLMDLKDFSFDEEKNLESLFRKKVNNLGDVLQECSRTLSFITNYVSIVLYPKLVESRFKRIELILLDSKKILVIMLNSTGFIKESILELDENINAAELAKISKFLNEELRGLELNSIEEYLKRRMYLEKDSFYHMFKRALEIIDLTNFLKDEELVFHDGTVKMLSYPEFRNPDSIRQLLETFEEKSDLIKVLSEDLGFEGVKIYIGKENYIDTLKDFTVVTAAYRVGNYNVGSIGVIGPKRMSYPKVVLALNYFSDKLSRVLSEF